MTPKIGRTFVENEVSPNVFRSFWEASRDVLEAARASRSAQDLCWSDFRMNVFLLFCFVFFANFSENVAISRIVGF